MQSNGLPLGHSYRRMSKGMQGLYKMILAIASNADYLLLDEPFDGLDIIVRKKVIGLLLENLSESNRTAIIASHNLNELENIIDRALLIKGRTIAKDYRLETMRENARKIQFVFRETGTANDQTAFKIDQSSRAGDCCFVRRIRRGIRRTDPATRAVAL